MHDSRQHVSVSSSQAHNRLSLRAARQRADSRELTPSRGNRRRRRRRHRSQPAGQMRYMYARRSPTSHGPHGVQYASSARGSAETRQRPPQAPQAPPQPSAQARLRLVIRKAAPQQARHAARAMPRSPPESEHPARSASRARAPLGSMRSTADAVRRAPLRLAPGSVSGTCWA